MYLDNYTDIHSHILHGVDDGARSLDESLELLGKAHSEGIRKMFATAHYDIENGYDPSVDLIRNIFQELKARAKKEFPDIQLYLGSELYCAPEKVLQRVERGEALSMAGTRYLLLEFLEYGEHHESAEHICGSMLDIAKTEWFPILAHAQRYRAFEGKQELYRAMVTGGVYLQVNSYDLFDHADGWVKDNTRWIVENRLAHFIGTDTHRLDHHSPVMRSGVKYLYENYDEAYVDALVYLNAEKLIAGERFLL